MTKLGAALREKYKSPKEALRALGLDENLLKEPPMTNADLARRLNALSARQISVSALTNYLKPRLAMDAKVPMAKVFEGITGKVFKDKKPVIAERIKTLAKDKLAKDASLDDVEKVLDMLDGHEIGGGDESVSESQHNAMEAAAHGHSALDIPEKVGKEFAEKDKGKAFDAEGFKSFLKEKGMGEDDINSAMGMLPQPGMDESEEDKKKREDEEAKKASDKKAADKAAKDAEMKDMVTKPAMDAAIQAAVGAARAAERTNNKALNTALQKVRPIVGELAMAFDSAAEVYRHVLKTKGVTNADVIHESALETIIDMQPKIGDPSLARPVASLGMDSAQTKSFNERFPDAGRIGHVR